MDANASKIQSRQLKLLQLQQAYQIQKQMVRILSLTSLVLLALAWVTTLYWRFTLPFFFLHTLGTSFMLINQISTRIPQSNIEGEGTPWWKDIKMWFLTLLTLITGYYLFRSMRQCPF